MAKCPRASKSDGLVAPNFSTSKGLIKLDFQYFPLLIPSTSKFLIVSLAGGLAFLFSLWAPEISRQPASQIKIDSSFLIGNRRTVGFSFLNHEDCKWEECYNIFYEIEIE